MENLSVVAQLGELLALCGIASARCFMPTFLLCLFCRVGAHSAHFSPNALNQLAQQIPDAMLTNGGLFVLGCMAALELFANWNETAREFFSEANWDRYTKPFYAFAFALAVGAPESAAPVAAGVGDAISQVATPAVATNLVTNVVTQVVTVTNTVTQAVTQAVSSPEAASTIGSWTWSAISAGLAAVGTSIMCSFRHKIADVVRSLDPENDFKLQTLANAVEEMTWLAFLLVALVVPALAIILTGLAALCGYMVMRILRAIEDHNSHDCPDCKGRVHNSAIKCPHCKTEQPLPYNAVGFRGLATRAAVNAQDATAVHTHHFALLKEHRCPICATALTDKLVCQHCETRVWEQGVTREELVRSLDIRMGIGVAFGIFSSAIPIVGFVLTVVFLNFCVLRVFRAYESRGARIIGRIIFKFFKWSVLIVGIVFSSIPFIGILFLLPYICSYLRGRGRFLR